MGRLRKKREQTDTDTYRERERERRKYQYAASQHHRRVLNCLTEIHKPERPSFPSVAGRGIAAGTASFLDRSTCLQCGHYRAARRYNKSQKLSDPGGSGKGRRSSVLK